MLFGIGFTIFVLIVAFACLVVTLTFAPIVDELYAIRGPLVFGGWMFSIVMILNAFGMGDIFRVPIYAGLPWPWVVCIVAVFIPGINSLKAVAPITILSTAGFILKLYWKYQS